VAGNSSAEDVYKAGKLYFSSGDYPKAITALQKATSKGGLAKPTTRRCCWESRTRAQPASRMRVRRSTVSKR
jgi:hypothetical protein